MLLLGNSEWHQVESIALQATTLLRWDGVKVPPAVLADVAFCGAQRACRHMHASLSSMTCIVKHPHWPSWCCHAYSRVQGEKYGLSQHWTVNQI